MNEIHSTTHPNKKNVTISIISLFAVLLIAGAFIVGRILSNGLEVNFDSTTISSLQSEYNMDLSEAVLLKHSTPNMAQDVTDKFSFRVNDYSTFMEKYYFGEIVKFSEYDDHSYATYKCRPYPESSDSLQKRFTFIIKFNQSEDGGYDAELISYYE